MVDRREHTAHLPESLTEREQEILICLAQGLSNREIANRLHLAYRTVRWYNTQIYAKLGVNNREAALAVAEALGLLEAVSDEYALPETNSNLPAQTTAFVGRQPELIEIARLLAQPDTRLITILASGGMGKTRLALAAAERQLTHFRDGVFFVPLASLSSPDDIATAIAEHIGFSLYGSGPPKKQLIDGLRQKNMLLVLDNFEHLLDGAPLVATILKAAPNLRLLVTSREKLNLSGETAFPISGLHFPDGETPEDTLEYDAVKLFMQSAQRARPNFELDPNDLGYLARICRMTEGLPLGIELAAGWVEVLSLEQIATEIQQGIDILETEQRDVPERQRSVRATFNTTWARLDETERGVFMKVSVFRGGFMSEAAEAVAGASARHLRRLASKALVQVASDGRYTVHELLRQYAEEQLLAAGEAQAVHQVHSVYFMDFLSNLKEGFTSHPLEAALTIKTEFENIRRAWLWAIQHNVNETVSHPADCLLEAASAGNLVWETYELFQQAIAAFVPGPAAMPHPARDYIALIGEWLRKDLSNDLVDHQLVDVILARARQRNDQRQIAAGLHLLAVYCHQSGDYENSLAYYEQALQLWRAIDDPTRETNALMQMSDILFRLGRSEKAKIYLEECAGIRRQCGRWTSLANVLMTIAWHQILLGGLAQAQSQLDEAIAIRHAYGVPQTWGRILVLQALLLLFRGDVADAESYLAAIQQMAHKNRKTVDHDLALLLTGTLASIRGKDDVVRSITLSGIPEVPRTVFNMMSYMSWALTLMHCSLGNDVRAKNALYAALVESLKIMSPTLQQISLPIAAVLAVRDGGHRRAVELLGLAHTAQAGLTGWMAHWQLLNGVRADLEAQLGSHVYATAWEQGTHLGLGTVITQLIEEYSEQV